MVVVVAGKVSGFVGRAAPSTKVKRSSTRVRLFVPSTTIATQSKRIRHIESGATRAVGFVRWAHKSLRTVTIVGAED